MVLFCGRKNLTKVQTKPTFVSVEIWVLLLKFAIRIESEFVLPYPYMSPILWKNIKLIFHGLHFEIVETPLLNSIRQNCKEKSP